MSEWLKDLTADTKKLGRIMALVIILGIAGTVSVVIVMGGDIEASKKVLDDWIKLAGIAVVFYFVSAKSGE